MSEQPDPPAVQTGGHWPHGYSHWTEQPVTPAEHKLALVPQSMGDCWQGYCSCGDWRVTVSLYFRTRDEAVDLIRQVHREHAAEASK